MNEVDVSDQIAIARISAAPVDVMGPAMFDGTSGQERRDPVTFELTVTIANVSNRTQYVISDLCRMAYDAPRRVLRIEFSEHDLPDAPRLLKRSPSSRAAAVVPQQEVTMTARVASPLTFPADPKDERGTPSLVHLPADVDLLECAVAYGSSPPPQSANLASLDPPQDARTWGVVLTKSMKWPG